MVWDAEWGPYDGIFIVNSEEMCIGSVNNRKTFSEMLKNFTYWEDMIFKNVQCYTLKDRVCRV